MTQYMRRNTGAVILSVAVTKFFILFGAFLISFAPMGTLRHI
jgi:hypothetical protein